MTYLEVPGASLYYEVVGDGERPLLLCISGADGSCEIWKGFAECMKDHFTVVKYDRRGFSRSHLNAAQDYAHRLETDADDAARLIKHLSPSKPATVIGNSSGAIVSLKLLSRHPDILRTVIPYEPPAAGFLPDYDEFKAIHHDVYNTYREAGMVPAFQKFAKVTHADQKVVNRSIDPRVSPYLVGNTLYWFEREFTVYPLTIFDVDAEIAPSKDKLLLVNGNDSPKEAYQYRANVALASQLGLTVVSLPGEHVGHATHPTQFSEKLLEALKEKDPFYTKMGTP